MADGRRVIEVSVGELRAVAGFGVGCAWGVLGIFEGEQVGDRRVRASIEAARGFAEGGERTKGMREGAWGAMRAGREAREAGCWAAGEAARAGMAAAGAGFLHPLAKATQVKHIVGAGAYAARAAELAAGDDRTVGAREVERLAGLAGAVVRAVLRRYPAAPAGGGRAGELMRELDGRLRVR
ncbi:MAG TPA: exonuclease SbcC [Phycisphaerae bacterium]|nr:exonuclease SbcC [Phycisphaerae bacterium]